jgi:hypothetical protein
MPRLAARTDKAGTMGRECNDHDDPDFPKRPWNLVDVLVLPGAQDNWATFILPEEYASFLPTHIGIVPTPSELWVAGIEVAGEEATCGGSMPALIFAADASSPRLNVRSIGTGQSVRVRLELFADRPLLVRVGLAGFWST